MPRYKLTIEYDGTAYSGWQIQENTPTIQGALQAALSHFYDQPIEAQCSGRTDAGVHAKGQVAHIDAPDERDTYAIAKGINAILIPQPIVVKTAELVHDDFHARFDAKRRHYEYRIINRPSRAALDINRAWDIFRPLNIDAMREAAQFLIGKHDFNSFRSSECQSQFSVKTLDTLEIEKDGENVFIRCSAQSFLHNQVRIMVGTLAYVGVGKLHVADVEKIRDAIDRRAAAVTAPACGLYFMKVDY
ncbi:MAG: tRNA pseudouridine(38-40) synthase TruA [Rickettsiales bacterium]